MAKQRTAKPDRARETRQTVLQSGLAGAAAGVLAAAMNSSTGAMALDSLGHAVGVDFALGDEFGPAAASADEPSIAPFTTLELKDIRARLEHSAATIQSSREATDAEIEFVRSVAARPGLRMKPRNAG